MTNEREKIVLNCIDDMEIGSTFPTVNIFEAEKSRLEGLIMLLGIKAVEAAKLMKKEFGLLAPLYESPDLIYHKSMELELCSKIISLGKYNVLNQLLAKKVWSLSTEFIVDIDSNKTVVLYSSDPKISALIQPEDLEDNPALRVVINRYLEPEKQVTKNKADHKVLDIFGLISVVNQILQGVVGNRFINEGLYSDLCRDMAKEFNRLQRRDPSFAAALGQTHAAFFQDSKWKNALIKHLTPEFNPAIQSKGLVEGLLYDMHETFGADSLCDLNQVTLLPMLLNRITIDPQKIDYISFAERIKQESEGLHLQTCDAFR